MKVSSRRDFFFKSLGAAAVLASAKIVGAQTAGVCTVSPRQTSGPFVPDDFPFRPAGDAPPYIPIQDTNADLTTIDGNVDASGRPIVALGQVLYVQGRVLDQNCQPVAGASVYLWQADVNGHYNHQADTNVHSAEELDHGFQYRAHVTSDAQGRFQVKTIKPKYYPLDETGTQLRTAHLHFAVLHPGCDRLITQTYFEGDVLDDIAKIRELNEKDIILAPRGRILPELRPLIIEFRRSVEFADGPVGSVDLHVRRHG